MIQVKHGNKFKALNSHFDARCLVLGLRGGSRRMKPGPFSPVSSSRTPSRPKRNESLPSSVSQQKRQREYDIKKGLSLNSGFLCGTSQLKWIVSGGVGRGAFPVKLVNADELHSVENHATDPTSDTNSHVASRPRLNYIVSSSWNSSRVSLTFVCVRLLGATLIIWIILLRSGSLTLRTPKPSEALLPDCPPPARPDLSSNSVRFIRSDQNFCIRCRMLWSHEWFGCDRRLRSKDSGT